MKSTLSLLMFFISLGSAQAQTSLQGFNLSQETERVQLESKEFETLYRTDQVPSTCYRSEVQGTRTECHTEYDRQCHTEYRQECGYRYYPVCQTIPRNVCTPRQVCRTLMDQVCNSRGCTQVPRRECHTENQCHTQMDTVCHNEQRFECQTLPQTFCQNVPRQACTEVPNVVQVPYSCMKPVQVAVGQQLKLDTQVQVSIRIANFSEVGATGDAFSVKLEKDQVSLSVNSSTFLYQIVDEKRTEQMLSSTEKLIEIQYLIRGVSIKKLEAFSKLQISNGHVGFDHLEFSLNFFPEIPFKGHLKMTRKRLIGCDPVIFDTDFESKILVGEGSIQKLMYSALQGDRIKDKLHYVTLSFGLSGEQLKKGAINPEILNGLSSQPITTQFEGFPQ